MTLAIHNLHVLKKKGIKESDGTGYSPTIKKNYESYAQELKDKEEKGNDDNDSNSDNNVNKSAPHKIRLFVYTFMIMYSGSI